MLSKICIGRFTNEVCSIFCHLYLLIILLHRRLHHWLHLHILTVAVHWLHLFPAGPITRIVRLGVPRCKHHTNRRLDMITGLVCAVCYLRWLCSCVYIYIWIAATIREERCLNFTQNNHIAHHWWLMHWGCGIGPQVVALGSLRHRCVRGRWVRGRGKRHETPPFFLF